MHVKKLLLLGLMLALVAPFALATDPNVVDCPICVSPLEITNHFYVNCGDCCLAFEAAAAEAKATGTFYTDTCTIAAEANKNITMKVSMQKLTDATTGLTLPTDFTYRYKQDAGAWSAWVTKWAPLTDDPTLNFLHVNHKGYAWLRFKVSVVRSGLADHFGTYTTSVTVTVSGC